MLTLLTATPMESFLTNMGSVVTQVYTWVGNVVSTIMGSPLLLVTSGIMLAGAAVGIFARLLSRN